MEEKICGIYCIENLANGKKYVGLSIDINRRWSCHISKLDNNCHINKHLQSAWNNYGKDNFKFNIIEICNKDIINEREIYWIDKLEAFKNGYNNTIGGEGTFGYKLSKAHKAIISESLRHRKISDKTREKYSNHMISQFNDELFLKAYHKSMDSRKTPINAYNSNCELISTYPDIHSAAKDLNVEATNICKVLKHIFKTCGGYTFTYLDEQLSKEALSQRFIIERCKNKRSSRHNHISLIDNNGNIIKEYENARIASDELHVDNSSIIKVCKGKLKQTGGFIFKYA